MQLCRPVAGSLHARSVHQHIRQAGAGRQASCTSSVSPAHSAARATHACCALQAAAATSSQKRLSAASVAAAAAAAGALVCKHPPGRRRTRPCPSLPSQPASSPPPAPRCRCLHLRRGRPPLAQGQPLQSGGPQRPDATGAAQVNPPTRASLTRGAGVAVAALADDGALRPVSYGAGPSFE